MRVHLERGPDDFVRRRVRIYVLAGTAGAGGERILRLLPDGLLRWDELEPGVADLEPTLTLPIDVAEAIAPALLELVPPDRAQAEALRDTREVRDRLLTLVERLAEPLLLGPA